MDLKNFKKFPVLGIVRGIRLEDADALAGSAIAGGLETLEVTMNTPNAGKIIERVIKASGKKLTVGAGTVLNKTLLKTALDSGATFIVMPSLIDDVVQYCVSKNIPNFPGALTPQEIYNASRAGATMVKVFPSGFFGPAYFKEIKGPFNDIELLACGEVTPANIKEYFSSGASAVSFGASVFKKEWFAAGDFDSITKAIKKFVSAYKTEVAPGERT